MATKAELEAALNEANTSRGDDDKIVPDGTTKADLEKALADAGVTVEEKPAKKATKSFRVTAPLVQVAVGGRAVQFYSGDVLPAGVSDDSVKHLNDLGYLAEVDAPASTDDDN